MGRVSKARSQGDRARPQGDRVRPQRNRSGSQGVVGSTSTKPATSSSGIESLPAAERELVTRAYQKLTAKQALSREEQSAWRRFEKGREERLRWQYYASIPQKHWRAMSGRQTKVLAEQAVRYGIPFGGASVDLPVVVRALHDFLAENAIKLARDEDPLLSGASSPALERYREERAQLARLDRLEREGSLVPRDQARVALGRIAQHLRSAGETLERRFGPAALEILDEALDAARREIGRTFERSRTDNAIASAQSHLQSPDQSLDQSPAKDVDAD